MPIDKAVLGKHLRHLRSKACLTLEEAHNKTGIPVSSISYIETGSGNTEVLDRYISLAKLYGMTVDDLLACKETKIDEGLLFICSQIEPERVEQAKKVLRTFV